MGWLDRYGGRVTRAVDQASFTVVYDGEAVRGHRMDVRDLAPALLGMAELFQAAQQVLSPGAPRVSLQIRATEEGSFMVLLEVGYQHVVNWLNTDDAIAAGALVTFIGGGGGLFNLLTKRRRAKREEQLPDGSIRLEMHDNATFIYAPQVVTLAAQPAIRGGVDAVVRPLEREGIDTFDVRETPQAEPWVTITESDLPAISEALADDDGRTLLVDSKFDQLLTVVAPHFAGGKWKVREGPGGHPSWFWISVDDPEFAARVATASVAFTAGDRLLAKVWLRQWATDSGEIHTERSIVRVIKYIPAAQPVQEAMFTSAPADEG